MSCTVVLGDVLSSCVRAFLSTESVLCFENLKSFQDESSTPSLEKLLLTRQIQSRTHYNVRSSFILTVSPSAGLWLCPCPVQPLSLLGPVASLEMLQGQRCGGPGLRVVLCEEPGEKGLSASLAMTTPCRNLFLLKG